ncbi:hypothetical protein [Citreimonas salinaria]|nr:hypothetical protein [Citreimonas salinaria]
MIVQIPDPHERVLVAVQMPLTGVPRPDARRAVRSFGRRPA